MGGGGRGMGRWGRGSYLGGADVDDLAAGGGGALGRAAAEDPQHRDLEHRCLAAARGGCGKKCVMILGLGRGGASSCVVVFGCVGWKNVTRLNNWRCWFKKLENASRDK